MTENIIFSSEDIIIAEVNIIIGRDNIKFAYLYLRINII